ncbi:hypothetical protein COOONC_09404, partial [Cooperia oncophora]
DCHELWSKKQRKERRSINPRTQQFEGQESELSACPPAPTATLQYDRRRNSPSSNGYVNPSSINPSRTEAVEQAIAAVLQTSDTTQLIRLLQYTSEADDAAILSRLSQSAQFSFVPGDSRPIKERLLDVLSNRAHLGGLVPSGAIDLMDKMLLLDPKRRISAKDAISHFWIKNFDYSTVPPLRLPQHQDCHELWSKKQRKERRSINPRTQQFEGQESELSACPPAPTATLQYDRRRNSPSSNGYVNPSSINPSRTEAVEQAIAAVLQTSDTTQLIRLLQYTSEADDAAILSRLSLSSRTWVIRESTNKGKNCSMSCRIELILVESRRRWVSFLDMLEMFCSKFLQLLIPLRILMSIEVSLIIHNHHLIDDKGAMFM